MQAREIMSSDVACCTPETPLRQVALMMVEHDCGAIPVVRDGKDKRLVGIITDRDITCRTVAQGKNPLELTARDCLSSDLVWIEAEADVDDCVELMEQKQVRRIPVVDSGGSCCGIIAQADIARNELEDETLELVREVSQPV